MGDFLVHYFNVPGAYLICAAILAAALYLTTSFSVATFQTWAPTRFAFLHAAYQRWQDWRTARRGRREARALAKAEARAEVNARKMERADEKRRRNGDSDPPPPPVNAPATTIPGSAVRLVVGSRSWPTSI